MLADRGQLKNLDESFVVLPGSASVQRQTQAQQAGSQQGSSPGWASLIQQLTRALEIATTETKAGSCPVRNLSNLPSFSIHMPGVLQLDHPLCSRCMTRVKEETTKEMKEVEADIAIYEQALKRLQTEAVNAPSLQVVPGTCCLARHLVASQALSLHEQQEAKLRHVWFKVQLHCMQDNPCPQAHET